MYLEVRFSNFSCNFGKKILLFSKIICLIPPLLTLALGSDLFKCPPSFRYSSLSTHKVNTFFSAIPKCVTALVVIIVSLYVLSILKRILNQVVPFSNLPQPQPIERYQAKKFAMVKYIFSYLDLREPNCQDHLRSQPLCTLLMFLSVKTVAVAIQVCLASLVDICLY